MVDVEISKNKPHAALAANALLTRLVGSVLMFALAFAADILFVRAGLASRPCPRNKPDGFVK